MHSYSATIGGIYSECAQCETKENDKDTGKRYRCKHWFPSAQQPIGPRENTSERRSPLFVVWIDRRRNTHQERRLPTASGDPALSQGRECSQAKQRFHPRIF